MTGPMRILIVAGDDDKRNCVRQALERHGFDVDAVNGYTRAGAMLLDSKFDLIVAETEPAPDRIEFIKRIRTAPRLTGILILVIAEWGRGGATLALSQGADGYEPKPFDENRVITSIERLLRRQAAAAV